MHKTKTQYKESDTQFFEEVKRQQVFQDALRHHGFTRQDARPSQHNSVLVITKDEWTISPIEGQSKGLNVHFEARRRYEFRIEVAIDPYQGNIERDPDLIQKIRPTLVAKTKLLERLRTVILNTSHLPAHIQMNAKSLPAPNATRSQTILKFTGNLPADPSYLQAANFFAEVIDAITPIVGANLTGNTRSAT